MAAGNEATGDPTNEYFLSFKTELNLPGDRQTAAGPTVFDPAQRPTYIAFNNKEDAYVEVVIYSLSGKIVWKKSDKFTKGSNSLKWDGKNGAGSGVASGVYIYQVNIRPIKGQESTSHTSKIVVIRK
jgi:flagellar hook assembly protein FlgD